MSIELCLHKIVSCRIRLVTSHARDTGRKPFRELCDTQNVLVIGDVRDARCIQYSHLPLFCSLYLAPAFASPSFHVPWAWGAFISAIEQSRFVRKVIFFHGGSIKFPPKQLYTSLLRELKLSLHQLGYLNAQSSLSLFTHCGSVILFEFCFSCSEWLGLKVRIYNSRENMFLQHCTILPVSQTLCGWLKTAEVRLVGDLMQ